LIKKANYILVLPSWYPNKTSPYNGDFVQRHVQAISNYATQKVIYVVKDTTIQGNNKINVEKQLANNFTETIIYYKPLQTGISIIDKAISHITYLKLYKKVITKCIEENGLPQLVHVHIAYKAGLLANWARKKWNIPFIVTEHSVEYLPEARSSNHKLIDKIAKTVLRNATRYTTVSSYLAKHMLTFEQLKNNRVIFNVVNEKIFYPAIKQQTELTKFLHVSNFTEQKNFDAIVQAAAIAAQQENKFLIDCYGNNDNHYEKIVAEKGLQLYFNFKGERPQTELAEAMRQADALLLYSHYETFGCVLIEANACGTPVIVSDLLPFREFLQETVNAVFVERNNPVMLAENLNWFCNNKSSFDSSKIADTAKQFSYNNIGQQFAALYNELQ
jgi:glycosyltransferase involved in cell wall biosynthesis